LSDQGSEAKQRDKLLLRLLKTPPQPRSKRERGAENATRKIALGERTGGCGALDASPLAGQYSQAVSEDAASSAHV
jgi:hypothetical protein